jgi:hypothetical protein
MARYGVGATKTTAATANLWIAAPLVTTSSKVARIWEIGVFMETAAANTIQLFRQNAAGAGSPTNVAPVAEDTVSGAASCNLVTAYATTNPTAATVPIRRCSLPATIGAGIIWTFPAGLVIPVSSSVNLFQVAATACTYGIYVAYDE